MNWWRYAAAAALLIAAGIWVLSSLGSSDNSLTAFRQENYIEPAPDALVRGGEEVLGEAGRSFARKDYSAAAEALEVIPAADSLFIAARYLQGHSYYQMGEYRQAVVAFSKCLDPPQGVNYDLRDFNRDNAAWTRILAQLALMEQDQDPLIRQDLRNYFSDFMQTADRSDTYYTRGLELEKWIVE